MWQPSTALWYFFSALAQSAAGFAALVAVFAVFRLQASASALEGLYRNVLNWFQIQGKFRPMDVSFSRDRIKHELAERTDSEALDWKKRITQLEEYPKTLALRVSSPLKLWAYLFFFSLSGMLWPSWPGWWRAAGFLGAFVLIGVSVRALLVTRKFIQDCLKP